MSTNTSSTEATDALADAPTTQREEGLFTVPLAAEIDDVETVALAPSDFASAGMGPRTRWAAIVWGLLFAVIAAGTLAMVIVPARRFELAEWIVSLEPATFGLYGALLVGTLVLLASLVGLLRRGQRKLAQRRLAS